MCIAIPSRYLYIFCGNFMFVGVQVFFVCVAWLASLYSWTKYHWIQWHWICILGALICGKPKYEYFIQNLFLFPPMCLVDEVVFFFSLWHFTLPSIAGVKQFLSKATIFAQYLERDLIVNKLSVCGVDHQRKCRRYSSERRLWFIEKLCGIILMYLPYLWFFDVMINFICVDIIQ